MLPAAFGHHPRLYSCTQRVAFHVHTSRLLSRLSCENLPELLQASASDVAAPTPLEEDTRKVVDGMNDMMVSESGESAAASRKRKEPETRHKSGLKTCSAAIEKGQSCFDNGDFTEALELFTAALELPGKGAMRMSGSVREYACPSEGEEQAALYNMACCYARLNEVESGLAIVTGLLESGFDDFETLRSDADLASLRTSREFEALLSKFDTLASRILGRKKRKTEQKKNWLSRW